MCDLDPKVKVIGQKAGICDGVPSTSALVLLCFCFIFFSVENGAPGSVLSDENIIKELFPLFDHIPLSYKQNQLPRGRAAVASSKGPGLYSVLLINSILFKSGY